MAIITSFRPLPDLQGLPHPTRVECRWKVFAVGATRMLQLDTYGSEGREIPGKVSQTLQLDRERARDLCVVLREAFPDL